MLRSVGPGQKGAKGDVGSAGSQGATGSTGATPVLTIGTVSTLTAGSSATASVGGTVANPTLNLGIPQGAAGSNASATPLSSATPVVDTTSGTAGVSTSAARGDHAHPRVGLNLQLLGNVTVTETLLVSLSLGTKRMTLSLAGVTTADKLIAAPNGIPTAGCEMINVYPISAGNVSVGYFVPALGIGATYSIPITIYRVV